MREMLNVECRMLNVGLAALSFNMSQLGQCQCSARRGEPVKGQGLLNRRLTGREMLNAECEMLNVELVAPRAGFSFNIQHSTFNIQHSEFETLRSTSTLHGSEEKTTT